MPYSDDAPDRPDPILAAARIGELTRLALWLEQPGLSLDDVRRYVAERLERIYPLDFHIYRQRWQALDGDNRPEPLLSFLEWWPLAQDLAERAAVAGMLGEVDGRVRGLLADGGWRRERSNGFQTLARYPEKVIDGRPFREYIVSCRLLAAH